MGRLAAAIYEQVVGFGAVDIPFVAFCLGSGGYTVGLGGEDSFLFGSSLDDYEYEESKSEYT